MSLRLGVLALLGHGLLARADDHDLILEPADKTGKQIGLVMLSGAQIANTAYEPMLKALQEAASSRGMSLFAGSPVYAFDMPEPLDLPRRMSDIQKELVKKGMSESAPMFYAAHSLGTVFMQDAVKALGAKAAGQILMGGFLLRKHLTPSVDYGVPTLTLGAELDGLARITRMAESFYLQKGRADLPVVVLPGQNHMQFGSGTPPSNVRKHDLEPEVLEEAAHGAIASATMDFIAQRLSIGGASDLAAERAAAARQQATEALLQPILDAYQLEGSRRFGTPDQYGGAAEKSCAKGLCPSHSPWAPEAQKVISGPVVEAAGQKLAVTNDFVMLGGSPATGQDFHLPNITNKDGVVTIKTYSECYWNDIINEAFEDFDTGFTYTSAQEIGTKLYSRQCTANVGLGQQVDFSVDAPEFCGQTNQMAYDWALAHAPTASLERFKKSGIPLVMGPGISKEGGPLWLYARLEFNAKTVGGKSVMEVSAPFQSTSQDYWESHFHIPLPPGLPDPGCYHYCKLLSPARAMEWIMVDGLRASKSTAEVFV